MATYGHVTASTGADANTTQPAPATLLEKSRSFLELLSQGCARKEAALASGLTWQQVSGWLADGENGKAPWDKLLAQVERAEAAAQVELVRVVWERAAEGDHRAAQWILERRNPDNWGAKTTTRLGGEAGNPVRVVRDPLEGLTKEEILRLARMPEFDSH